MSSVVTSERRGAIVILTIRRAEKRNALSIAVRDEMSDHLDHVTSDPATSVVVITGDGDTFSAGFDLGEFGVDGDDHHDRLWASSDRFHQTILRCPLPTIAAVNGPALAGGFDLAVMCDLRVAATTARFEHVEQRWSDIVYRPLHDLIGGAHARELVLSGRSVGAQEAMAIGLVNQVCPPSELMDATLALGQLIARAPRDALVRTKAKIIAAAAIDPGLRTLEL